MAKDLAKLAVREVLTVKKYDHDACGPEGQHICAAPFETVSSTKWFIENRLVTDPAEIERLESKIGGDRDGQD